MQVDLADAEDKQAKFKEKLEHEKTKLKDFDAALKEVETAYAKVCCYCHPGQSMPVIMQ